MNELNTKAQDVPPLIWCGMCGQWAFRGQRHDCLQTHGRLFFLQRNEFFPPHSFFRCFEWQLTGSSCPCFVLRRGGVRSRHPLTSDRERAKDRSVPSLTTMATAYSVSDLRTHSHTHTWGVCECWLWAGRIPGVIVWFSAVTLCVSGSSNKQTSWSPNKAQKRAVKH